MNITTSMVQQMRELRKQGLSYKAIGQTVGVSDGTAHKYTHDVETSDHIRRGVHYTTSEMITAKKMWRDGALLKEIAVKLGRTSSAISSMVIAYRDQFPSRKSVVTEAMANEMRVLRAQGMTFESIATRVGVSDSTVKKYARGIAKAEQ